MENVILGPICCYMDDTHLRAIISELFNQGWLPLYRLSRGRLLDELRASMPENIKQQIKGLVIMVGYRKFYEV